MSQDNIPKMIFRDDNPYRSKPLSLPEFLAFGAEVGCPEGIRRNHSLNNGLDQTVKYSIYLSEHEKGGISWKIKWYYNPKTTIPGGHGR